MARWYQCAPHSSPQVRALVRAGANAHTFLCGESSEPSEKLVGFGRDLLVKICGVRDPDAAVHAARSGADLVGLILVPGSARHVSGAAAHAVTAALRAFREQQDPAPLLAEFLPPPTLAAEALSPKGAVLRLAAGAAALQSAARRARPLSVGVFMNQSPAEVLAAALEARVDIVQLHGHEVPADFYGFPLPIVKVLHVPVAAAGAVSSDAEDASGALASGIVDWGAVAAAVLMDSTATLASPSGGSGLVFEHDTSFAAAERALHQLAVARPVPSNDSLTPSQVTLPILMAGGLTPENIDAALGSLSRRLQGVTGASSGSSLDLDTACLFHLQLCGVDVSSGVEAAGAPKGTKDPERVSAFVSRAKTAQAAGVPPRS